MRPGQKSECEKNHEELRQIPPKRRSGFDELAQVDVAAVRSHDNSYPRPAWKVKRLYDLAARSCRQSC